MWRVDCEKHNALMQTDTDVCPRPMTNAPPDVLTACTCRLAPDNACKSCAARRRIVRRMRRDGRAVREIADRMGLTPRRVLRLLEASDDREALPAFRKDTIAVALVRDLFVAWRAADPDNRSYLELARLAGYDSSSRAQRLLGVVATSPVSKDGTVYPGRILTEISCENAGRLVRAMGHLPCEIPWL
jgi:hypothetical protein